MERLQPIRATTLVVPVLLVAVMGCGPRRSGAGTSEPGTAAAGGGIDLDTPPVSIEAVARPGTCDLLVSERPLLAGLPAGSELRALGALAGNVVAVLRPAVGEGRSTVLVGISDDPTRLPTHLDEVASTALSIARLSLLVRPRGFTATWVASPGLMLLRLDLSGHPVGEPRLVLPGVADHVLIWAGDAYALLGRIDGQLSVAVFGPDGALRGTPQPVEVEVAAEADESVPWPASPGACLSLWAGRGELPMLAAASCAGCKDSDCGAVVLGARILGGMGLPVVDSTRRLVGVSGDAAFWVETGDGPARIAVETATGIARLDHPAPEATVTPVQGGRSLLLRTDAETARFLNAADLAHPAVATFKPPAFDVVAAGGTDAGTVALLGIAGDAVVGTVLQCR